MNLKERISEYPDFPKKGILFRDFSPLLADPAAVSLMLDEITRIFHPGQIDAIAGIESRGFIMASALAQRHGKPIIMIRKAGKLPGKKLQASYALEYGKATIEIQRSTIKKNSRVLICDDLLATGGTAAAAAGLVEKAGAKVAGIAFLIELSGLGGAAKISKYRHKSLVAY